MDRLTGSKSLTKIFLRVLRVIRGFFLVAYGKKSFVEIFNKNMAYGQK